MRLCKGFLLLDFVIYSALTAMLFLLLIQGITFFIRWHTQAPVALDRLLYHQRAITIVANDLVTAEVITQQNDRLWQLSGYSYTKQWEPVSWHVLYEHRSDGLYRTHKRETPEGNKTSTVRLTPSLHTFQILSKKDSGGELIYGIQKGTTWNIPLSSLWQRL